MALRPIFLAALTAMTPFLSAQTPPVAPIPSVRVRTVVSHPKTTGKTDVISTPTITAASGSEARVTIAGKPDASGKVENAMEMTVTPTANVATGEITLALHIVLTNNKSETSALSDKPDKKEKKRSKDGSPVAHEGLPIFHSALAADGLFSLEDAKGVRRWVPLRRTIDGWKLESYDKEKEILILTQGSARQELPLHKSVVSASATEINTVITVKSGEPTKVGGMGGVEVTITADIVR